MSTTNSGSKTRLAVVLTAVAASLCCITPVLALFIGATGIASAFSWLELFRPYLIGLTVAGLSFAWYQKLKPVKTDIDCVCERDEKPSFWQSKTILGIVTVFAIAMLAFPKYSHIFYPKVETKEIIVADKSNVQEAVFKIRGMTCESCTQTINLALSKVSGVLEYQTDFKKGNSSVKFDDSKTTEQEIIKAINETGYKVVPNSTTNK